MKILVINGPNLNLLGTRESDIYGTMTLEDINASLQDLALELNVELTISQSNHEGEIVDQIHNAKDYAALVINPAAYTHTSVAIRDAIAAVEIPAVEIHLSNIYKREEFRHKSLISPVAHGQVSGFGPESYLLGLRAAVSIANAKKGNS
jgi:3-dehydroquinate dehydratase-2